MWKSNPNEHRLTTRPLKIFTLYLIGKYIEISTKLKSSEVKRCQARLDSPSKEHFPNQFRLESDF